MKLSNRREAGTDRLPKLRTLRFLAGETGVPRSTWYTLAARGEISVVRIGRSVRIDESDAAAFLAARRKRAGQGGA